MVTSELTPIQKQEARDKLVRLFNIFIPVSIFLGALAGVLIGSFKIKIPISGSMDNYNQSKKKLGRYTVRYEGSPAY